MTVGEYRERFKEAFQVEYMNFRIEVEAQRVEYEMQQRGRPIRRLLTALRIARFFPIKHRYEPFVPDRSFW